MPPLYVLPRAGPPETPPPLTTYKNHWMMLLCKCTGLRWEGGREGPPGVGATERAAPLHREGPAPAHPLLSGLFYTMNKT